MLRLGGLELGGTTCVVSFAIATPLNIVCNYEIPTTTPDETLLTLCRVLVKWGVDSIGVASFGPVALEGEFWGWITSTPKPGWRNTNVVEIIRKLMVQCSTSDDVDVDAPVVPERTTPLPDYSHIHIGFNTDVNAAVQAERTFGQHTDSSLVYITVGTGIGCGILIASGLLGGATHPEMGHVLVKKHPADSNYMGVCPYHGDCLEGLCSNRSLATRLGLSVSDLPALSDDHQYNNVSLWDLEAYYLGQLCSTLFLTVCPEVIVIGGGVINRPGLLQKIQAATLRHINGYISSPNASNIGSSIVLSKLQGKTTPGVVGALLLALQKE